MKRTDSYITTLDPKSTVDMENLQSMRKLVSSLNKVSPRKFRVTVRGRLGKGNPAARMYRQRRDYQMIQLKDATRYDVYIHERY